MLSRQFREIARSRIEALLASFPKLADSGTQHTTVEQDNVRFVYQPLDELYMVLITNRQSNILQDIDSLHLFAQVVSSVCKKLDEREILRHSFELLSAFDELVSLGYRENLSLSQIKTFLEMESHEERIQEIIARVRALQSALPSGLRVIVLIAKQNKELEANEERKRRAKQLELQRKEAARSGAYGRGVTPKVPSYPTYTPPSRPSVPDLYDSYEAERTKSFSKPLASRGKGMQLGKKSKNTHIFEKVRGDLGPEAEEDSAPLVAPSAAVETKTASARPSLDAASPVSVVIAEYISAKLSREGTLKSFEVKGDLKLRISDPSFAKITLALQALEGPLKAQFRTHPNVDKNAFTSGRTIQLKDKSKPFPPNNSIAVLRWNARASPDSSDVLPLTFTVWVNKNDDSFNITVEYELTSSDTLKDVTVTIPYVTSEPAVSSFDATYEVTGDSLEWTIGHIDESNANGSFEFEAQAEDEGEFFPMSVRFERTKPFVEVDVQGVRLVEMDEDVGFDKNVRSASEGYLIE